MSSMDILAILCSLPCYTFGWCWQACLKTSSVWTNRISLKWRCRQTNVWATPLKEEPIMKAMIGISSWASLKPVSQILSEQTKFSWGSPLGLSHSHRDNFRLWSILIFYHWSLQSWNSSVQFSAEISTWIRAEQGLKVSLWSRDGKHLALTRHALSCWVAWEL